MAIVSEFELSQEQHAAVESDARAIVVVASAGSGKTEVAARRVERLLTVSAGESFRILALSYTLKAADELAQRFRKRLGDLHRRVDANTVHGFAHSLLRQHGTRIGLPVEPEVLVRDEDRAELLVRWLESDGSPVPEDLVAVFQRLDLARAREQSAPLLGDWEAALDSAGALDYGSMLVRASELLGLKSTHRQLGRLYGHVIVDEAQNLTAAQYSLLSALIAPSAPGGEHLPTMIVGDDKQSIVGFAGADPRLIGRFTQDYGATRFELRQNFRSAEAIVVLGESVAEELGHLPAEAARAVKYAAQGSVELYEGADENDEARFVSVWVGHLLADGLPKEVVAPGEPRHMRPEDIAVLSRSAAGLRATKAAIEAKGHTVATSSSPEDWLATQAGKVAFELVALRSAAAHQSTHWQLGRLLDADETHVQSPDQLAHVLEVYRDPALRPLAQLCAIDEPSSFMAALTSIEMPSNVGGQLLAEWDADCAQLNDSWLSFVQQTHLAERTWGNFRLHVSRQQRGDDLAPGIRLLTIHKAQGREYRAVVLLGLNDGQIPDFRATHGDDQLAELRTFYVAVTRAGRVLLMTRAKSRMTRYGKRVTDPSPYLRFIRRGD
jgi:DNA helicase-2/ATP-dependent DNA helicase PcrA